MYLITMILLGCLVLGFIGIKISKFAYNFLFGYVGSGIILKLKIIFKNYIKHFNLCKLITGAIKTRLIVSTIPVILYLLGIINLSTVFVISSSLICIWIIYTVLKTKDTNRFKIVTILALNIIVLTVLFGAIHLIISYFYPMVFEHVLLLKIFFSMDDDLLFDYHIFEQEHKTMPHLNKSKEVKKLSYMKEDSSDDSNNNDDANSNNSSGSSHDSDPEIDNDLIEYIADNKHGIESYKLSNKLLKASIKKGEDNNNPDAEAEKKLRDDKKFLEENNSNIAEYKKEITVFKKELKKRGMSSSKINKKVEKLREGEDYADKLEEEKKHFEDMIKSLDNEDKDV